MTSLDCKVTCCGVVVWQADECVAGTRLVVRQAGSRDVMHHFISLGRLHLHQDALQELVVQRVGAIKLEHQVTSERVFDAANHVFRLRLRQLHRLRGLEQRTETLELGNGGELL